MRTGNLEERAVPKVKRLIPTELSCGRITGGGDGGSFLIILVSDFPTPV
jgi:hypothetical protein